MAMEDTGDAQRSYKELKKMAKKQKKAKKKKKKREKIERKIAKKEAKMRKKGVFVDEAQPPETAPHEEKPEEFAAGPWVRKSTEAVPFVEKKIDRIAERRERSKLHDLFEEKYGESLIVPETYQIYELSEDERARLERMEIEAEEAVAVDESVPVEGVAVEAEGAVVASGKVEAAGAEAMETEAAEGKPFYHPLQLWLYTKYGKDKMIVLKILILIVSVVGFVILFLPRVVIFLIMLVVKKIKRRKAEKVASEA